MKINILYFSGTGNTQYVANYLGEKLKEESHVVKIKSIDENPKVDEDIDLLIIGGPNYASNVPEKLLKWVNKNVPKKNSNAIVYCTSAGKVNAYGAESLAKKLTKKGYNIVGKDAYVMPRNFYFGKYSQNTNDEISQMLNETNEKLDILINRIKHNEYKFENIENNNVFKIDVFAKLFNLIAKTIGKSFSVDDTCIKCGKCIKNCPKKNIRYDKNKEIKFGNNCMACMRCIHNCPKNSINYNNKKYNQYNLNRYIKAN
ncbi:EFR1 family ferrodoxin [Paraclostridium ghonii]|uniref:Flavodoxin/Pyruvate/2-oxoacid:ferredoxin oxidoreductase delta subunit n=1 Tax=Paraclostridium ghonii TaxID=29358 RepID=A0ABU0N1I3_9FIRM|nr:EFR1 family ferrodoxin [Paeniclostridium ghonii]MDQ0557020.1 flavodoxin/Pyruvate/2-oxoacid:ferredoxin oxidoreductase delta subunit [Paeniclostridium ghonii]